MTDAKSTNLKLDPLGWRNRTHLGDCRDLLREMADSGVQVQCIVTSPPYWGLRDYGVDGAIGLEPTLGEWLEQIVEVFRLARAVLAEDGTLWLNLGDSYANGGRGGNPTEATSGLQGGQATQRASMVKRSLAVPDGLKPKDLMGQPWRVAFALQEAGWWLRSDIVWHKPNPMPESVTDRPTKAHEYVFLLAKGEHYYYDASAIAEPASPDSHARASRGRLVGYEPPGQRAHAGIAAPRAAGVNPKAVAGWAQGPGSHGAKDHARAKSGLRDSTKFGRGAGWRNKQNESFSAAVAGLVETRNVRTVWTIPTQPYSGAHFATFPEALVARCILAGSRPGDIVLDPFMGSGTVGKVATDLGRKYIGCEISPEYFGLHDSRRTTTGMPI